MSWCTAVYLTKKKDLFLYCIIVLTIMPDGDYLFITCKYTDEVIAMSLKDGIMTISQVLNTLSLRFKFWLKNAADSNQ